MLCVFQFCSCKRSLHQMSNGMVKIRQCSHFLQSNDDFQTELELPFKRFQAFIKPSYTRSIPGRPIRRLAGSASVN